MNNEVWFGWFILGVIIGFFVCVFLVETLKMPNARLRVARQCYQQNEIYCKSGQYYVLKGSKMVKLPL